uniref:Alcohol dehydrogenase-like N-terminal domain-containing protein n=1 Tax=Strigamia maritima TaxID=126957 RepID=T1IX41_STRMM
MAGLVTRVVFVGASKKPSFVTETCPLPTIIDLVDGEVLLKIRLATICTADLDTLDGKWTKPIPSVMGHEGVGEVLVSKRLDLVLGDRVVFSTGSACESCVVCRRNLPVPCATGIQYGHGALLSSPAKLSGTLASHLILRKGTHVIKIPPHVKDTVACTVNCPLSTMVNVVDTALSRLNGCGEKKIAVIQGINIFAIYGCLLLKEVAGFNEVYLTDQSMEQQKLATLFGGIPSFDRKGISGSNKQHLDMAVEFLSKLCLEYPLEELISPKFSLHDLPSAIKTARGELYCRVAVTTEGLRT